jgi:hypothetical protein
VTAPRTCATVEVWQQKEDFMKTNVLVSTLFAIASFPLLAQQPSQAGQQPQASQQQHPSMQSPQAGDAAPPSSPDAGPQAPAAQLSPVNVELVSALDSKTAKNGDSVVVQTKASVKTADGTEIPKGSKLVGHVIGAKASGAGENSQVALLIDHLELKGGQSLPIHSEIESIAAAGGAAPSSSQSAATTAPAGPTGSADGKTNAAGAGAANTPPAPGTIIARTGKIAIHTTSVSGVMLANNAPGEQDPRMAQASSILLGAKQDIHLDGGTQMVLGVAGAGGAAQ